MAHTRFVYVGLFVGNKGTFVAENRNLLKHFFTVYQVPEGAIALSDNGNSFFENGDSVLVKCGFFRHECYPSPVHQYLSPNDNHLHGVAKQVWRNEELDYKDDVKTSINFFDCFGPSFFGVYSKMVQFKSIAPA